MPPHTVVYHMTTRADWEGTPPDENFVAATLANEGFIHCTAERERVLQVANRFYRGTPGEWVILTVAVAQLTASLRWETADDHLFPMSMAQSTGTQLSRSHHFRATATNFCCRRTGTSKRHDRMD
jgi:uncharacterized protein (DUF952 family)